MKKFTSRLSLVVFLSLSNVIFLKMTVSGTIKNYNSTFVDKLKILELNKNKNKIILIGGSSVGWGISAEQIEHITGIKTINLGHHAGYGLMDFQDFILKNINPNDIIIFSPEWCFYENPEQYDTATLDDLMINNFEYGVLTNNLYAQFKSVLLRDFSILKSNKTEVRLPYSYRCINKNGDVVSHCGLKPIGHTDYEVRLNQFDMSKFIHTFPYLSRPNTLLLFPPTQKAIFKRHLKHFTMVESILSTSELKIIDTIKENVYDEADFFYSEYHLKCEMKKDRTNKIILAIQKSR